MKIGPSVVRYESGPHLLLRTSQGIVMVDDRSKSASRAAVAEVLGNTVLGDHEALVDTLRRWQAELAGVAAILADGPVLHLVVVGGFIAKVSTGTFEIAVTATGEGVEVLPLPESTKRVVLSALGNSGTDPARPLGDGTVRASTVEIETPRSEPDLQVDSLIEPHRGDLLTFMTDRVTPGRADTGSDGVLVTGVLCSDDHFNHKDQVFCILCGRKMIGTKATSPVSGERPPLGVLLLDDGTTISVDGELILGRAANAHEDVKAGIAQAVAVADSELDLSRIHFAVRLEGWDIYVVDLAATNGTRLRRANADGWTTLAAGDKVLMQHGDMLSAGSRLFELHCFHGQ